MTIAVFFFAHSNDTEPCNLHD